MGDWVYPILDLAFLDYQGSSAPWGLDVKRMRPSLALLALLIVNIVILEGY